ncbi:MAG: hypothetical protein ABW076_18730 [Candidatus Thiodiazotropha sp.]
MGYKLTSLANLPFNEKTNMYIFIVGGGGWEGGLDQIIHENFDKLAADIGGAAVIVGALTEEFHGQVIEKYLGNNGQELLDSLPALLITDCHPDKLNDDSMRLLIPLSGAHENYPVINQFLSDLTSFARGESDVLLKNLEKSIDPKAATNDIVKVNIPVVPGVISINMNGAVKNLREWWNNNAHNKQIHPTQKTRG